MLKDINFKWLFATAVFLLGNAPGVTAGAAGQGFETSLSEERLVERTQAEAFPLGINVLAPQYQDADPTVRLIKELGGGLIGGAIGFGAGILTVKLIGRLQDFPAKEPALLGTAGGAGMTLGIPLGVHFADRNRGTLWLSMAASAVVGAAGLIAVFEVRDDRFIAVLPLVQMGAAILIEEISSSP